MSSPGRTAEDASKSLSSDGESHPQRESDTHNVTCDEGDAKNRKRQGSSTSNDGTEGEPYRKVIAILPRCNKKAVANGNSSDDDDSDCSDGNLNTSSSSSCFDEGIPFPTKPQVIVKKTEIEQSQSASHQ